MAHSEMDSNSNRSRIASRSNLTSNTDWVFRVQLTEQAGNTPPTLKVTGRPTQSITQPIRHLMEENGLLRDTVRNLWQLYRYHQEYESFLLGTCSEADFLAVAERYAISFQGMPAQRLTWASLLLINILGEPLTSGDLSVLLNVDVHDLENTLASSAFYAIPR
jgi:hypothetical protein